MDKERKTSEGNSEPTKVENQEIHIKENKKIEKGELVKSEIV